MCIIAIKPKNVPMPSMDTLNKCFSNNDDGSGFAYLDKEKNKIIIEKGYMTWKSFKKAIKKHAFKEDDTVVLHFRIATHGNIGQAWTHPFPVSNKDEDLFAINIECDYVAVHNGMIAIDCEKNLSDTQTYIKEVLFPLGVKALKKEHELKLIELSTQGSRLVLWSVKHGMVLTGKYIEDEGVLYSNDTYKTHYVYKYDYTRPNIIKRTSAKSSSFFPYGSYQDEVINEYVQCANCGVWLDDDAYCGDFQYYCEHCGKMTYDTNELDRVFDGI